jgi:3-oxoacyl-[acyl-carrier protein] reductase
MDLGLKGRVALVTGASKGIGKAVAEEFAKEGAQVSICARGQQDLARAAEELRRYGVTVVATSADVTRAGEVQHVIDATLKKCGRIDILVNNAGECLVPRTVETTDEQWQHGIELNLFSAVRFTRGVVPHMRAQGGGRIINIASIYGRAVPTAGSVDYNAAKAALMSFSRTMAVELAPNNILVNSVCPGFIAGPLQDRLADSVMPVLGMTSPEAVREFLNQYNLQIISRNGSAGRKKSRR